MYFLKIFSLAKMFTLHNSFESGRPFRRWVVASNCVKLKFVGRVKLQSFYFRATVHCGASHFLDRCSLQ